MALTPDDVAALGRMLDERIERVQAEDRRRRRRWLRAAAWIAVVGTLLSTALAWWMLRWMRAQVDAHLAEVDRQFLETKLAYQAELRRSEALRKERAEAERATGYRSTQDRASYEAGLVSAALRAITDQAALAKRMEALDPDDPDALIAATEAMGANLNTALGTLGQILLRNTDPAHNTPEERLLGGGDGGGDRAAPLAAEP